MEEALSSKFYITSPIYYVNDIPHIGHAYTTIIVDSLARFHRLKGDFVFFLTGTDEHGQKIEQSAQKKGQNPKDYVDCIAERFKSLWNEFEINYDYFIRTTDSTHQQSVQNAFLKMFQKGDIYKGEYEGNYCISCESFFSKSQLVNEKNCPDCGKETTLLKEESYFFKLGAYADKLLKFYDENPNFILPKSKRNEVINFVKAGLEDLSITRTSFHWGIKLPKELLENDKNNQKHVMYVWLDALINYLSALGFHNDLPNKMDFWPANYHIVGKDILRFHAVYWPAFLMSLELPLPRHIAAHGWWTKDGSKMSKSVGNVVNPKEVVEAYGLDAFRYFVLREVPFGQDGDFSQNALIERINADLSNDLGNLLNRLLGMSAKYFNNTLEADLSQLQANYNEELAQIQIILNSLESQMEEVQINRYLEELWKLFSLGNGIIAKKEPWQLIKNGKRTEVAQLLLLLANILLKAALFLSPCMPRSAEKILKVFGLSVSTEYFRRFILQGELLDSVVLKPIPVLFPRIEERLLQDPKTESETKSKDSKSAKLDPLEVANPISKDDFTKIDIRIGTIISAEILPKSEKLLKLQVDLGEARPRQILAGIKAYYTPEELLGKQVCVLANLKPAKLMGELSEGMILAAKDSNGLAFITPQNKRKDGSQIS
ncbi:methionine--tRNA ligase [Helicobacter turcicus]|uniref:Methionine--tRNA ligase n=1 Tax=Helicobacter turcicus TaxID=2867412 RepID=A0ABS7JN26_9HELI|nr:methionine--tRNA ligase [Helicobacter turcicus]MBX7490778.1 methionine--tRNA ligase [Helicobacter turcicus]MBX7545613.1 methionine--tRNA ligase [Helicobacter turcicus]